MKTFRKALSIILGLAIMLSCVAGMQVSVAAEGTLALKVGEATIENGVVTVPVVVEEGNPGFQALGVTVGYDANVLKLEEVVKNDNFSDAQNYLPNDGKLTDNGAIGNPEKNPITIMWSYSLVDADITATGTIATLTFSVVNDDYVGTTDIDLTVTQAYNVAEEDLLSITTATDGTVTFPCKHANTTTTTKEATCLEAGSTTVVCNKCGITLSTVEIPVKAHDYKYTDNGDGTHSATCPNGCEGIASEEHTYVDGVCDKCDAVAEVPCEHVNTSWNVTTAPSYTTTGVRDLICDDCGAILEANAVAPRVLRIASAALVLENNISIVWKIDATYFTTGGYTNPCLTFTFNGVSEDVYDYEVNGSQYWFYFRKAKPQDMLDTVNATIKATYNGDEIVGTDSKASIDYSIYQYCSSQLGKQATVAKLRRLIVDLLNYGAAKQIYVGKNVDNLPNANISEDQLAFGTESIRTDLENKAAPSHIVNENTTVEFKGATLVLLDSVEVQAQFASKGSAFTGAAGELDGYSIVVTAYDDKDKVEQSWTLTPEDTAFTFNSTNKRYLVNFNGLRARQFSTEAYFTVYKDGVAISDTLRYTIESYAARNYSSTNNTNLKSLLAALMNYGDSAYYYVLGKEVNAE